MRQPESSQLVSPSEPLPLVFCITELDPGGAEQALVQMVTRLDRSLWTSTVICLGPEGALAEPLRQAGVEVICLGARGWKDLAVLPRLTRELRRLQPVLVQTFLFHANLLGRLAARRAGIRFVVSGIRVAERRPNQYLRLDRWTDRWVTCHVCVSESVRQFSVEQGKLPAEKLVVIPNGVDLEKFAHAKSYPRNLFLNKDSQEKGSEQEAVCLALFVGRLDTQKGLTHLVSAAAQLQRSQPQLRWILAGEGPEREALSQQIRQAGLEERVQLLGRREDIPELMKTADLFVFPSLWEGMPNVILEAMAARLPIVSTAVEGITELLTAGESAEIVPVGEAAALAAAVTRLLEQPERARQFAERAYQTVSSEWTWDRTARLYQALYRMILLQKFPLQASGIGEEPGLRL